MLLKPFTEVRQFWLSSKQTLKIHWSIWLCIRHSCLVYCLLTIEYLRPLTHQAINDISVGVSTCLHLCLSFLIQFIKIHSKCRQVIHMINFNFSHLSRRILQVEIDLLHRIIDENYLASDSILIVNY